MRTTVALLYRVCRGFYPPIFIVVVGITTIIIFYTIEDNQNKFGIQLPVSRKTQWWRFVSPCLTHINSLHLWSNMSIILTCGVILELMHGFLTTSAIYLIGGTTGIMMETAFNENATNLIGASASAYALIAGYIGHLVLNWKETPFRLFWALCVILFVALSIVTYIDDTNQKRPIAHMAHLGGFIQGFFVSCVVVQNKRIHNWEYVINFSAFILAGAFIWSVCLQIAVIHHNT